MRFRLTPQDDSILESLGALAAGLPRTADLLSQSLGSVRTARAEAAAQLGEEKQGADDAARAVLARVNESFVTPFDREDLFRLTAGLQDCVDLTAEVADRAVLYAVTVIPDAMVEQVQLIQRCAELTADAFGQLRRLERLREFWVAIAHAENAGDRIHRELLRTVFDGTSPARTDPIAVLKLKDLADGLEAAVNAYERLARAVEMLAIKES